MKAQDCFQLLLAVLQLVELAMGGCSRERSRIVRNLVKNTLMPVYVELGVAMEPTCPIYPQRDIYGYQEDNKVMETGSKWVCNFCGKAFYEERHLDNHLHNKHDNTLNKKHSAVCLEEWCEVFRCDVVVGTRRPDYWDRALCRQSDLDGPRDKCHSLIEKCSPSNIAADTRQKLLHKLDKNLCDYLTCEKYFELPQPETQPVHAALYALAFMFLAIGVLIYYYIAYTHYYTDENIFDQLKFESERKYTYYHRSPGGHVLRQRTKVFR